MVIIFLNKTITSCKLNLVLRRSALASYQFKFTFSDYDVSCVVVGHTGHGSVEWWSHGSWVTSYDPLSALMMMWWWYIWQLDDDVCRAVDEISQSDTPSLSHQLDDTSAIWRPASEPDTTSVLLHRLFDELLFYVTDQVDSIPFSL